jgi:hypothetical protein
MQPRKRNLKKKGFRNKKFPKTIETSKENFTPEDNGYNTVYGRSAKK